MPQPRKSLDCTTCPQANNCFLYSVLTESERPDVERGRMSTNMAKSELLYCKGDETRGLWIVCRGQLKTYGMTKEGKSLLRTIAGPGDILGYGDFVNGSHRTEFAEAIKPSVVAYLNMQTINTHLADKHKFSIGLLQQMAADLTRTSTHACNIAYSTARQRVIDALSEFADITDPDYSTGGFPVFALRRLDLAERTGLTMETTVRTLKELESDRKVRLHRHYIEILFPTPGVLQQTTPSLIAA